MNFDQETLIAAIRGYRSEISRIQGIVEDLERRITPKKPVASANNLQPKRKLTAAGRAAIAAAQKRRWAAKRRGVATINA